jgi:hypothetical protein
MNARALFLESPIDQILPRLDSLRRSGHGYTARCPSHDDRTASLSVCETDTGKVLIHCFAGCSAPEVLQTIGLTLADLFPNRLPASTPEQMRAARMAAIQTNWKSALTVLAVEATVAVCACEMLLNGEELSAQDRNRLHAAHDRIQAAREVLNARL